MYFFALFDIPSNGVIKYLKSVDDEPYPKGECPLYMGSFPLKQLKSVSSLQSLSKASEPKIVIFLIFLVSIGRILSLFLNKTLLSAAAFLCNLIFSSSKVSLLKLTAFD